MLLNKMMIDFLYEQIADTLWVEDMAALKKTVFFEEEELCSAGQARRGDGLNDLYVSIVKIDAEEIVSVKSYKHFLALNHINEKETEVYIDKGEEDYIQTTYKAVDYHCEVSYRIPLRMYFDWIDSSVSRFLLGLVYQTINGTDYMVVNGKLVELDEEHNFVGEVRR